MSTHCILRAVRHCKNGLLATLHLYAGVGRGTGNDSCAGMTGADRTDFNNGNQSESNAAKASAHEQRQPLPLCFMHPPSLQGAFCLPEDV